MQTHSTSGFSVIPLVLLLAASGYAWVRLYDVAMAFAQTATGG